MILKEILIILMLYIVTNSYSQSWSEVTDTETGIKFSAPSGVQKFDSLMTTLYSANVDSNQAVQVHIFKNAEFNNTDPIFSEALSQESGDTLRAIAKLILLASNSEVTAIKEITTDGIKGLEIGITYNALRSNTPYHTFVKYYLIEGTFVSFTWTGAQSGLKSGESVKNSFFNSVNIE